MRYGIFEDLKLNSHWKNSWSLCQDGTYRMSRWLEIRINGERINGLYPTGYTMVKVHGTVPQKVG